MAKGNDSVAVMIADDLNEEDSYSSKTAFEKLQSEIDKYLGLPSNREKDQSQCDQLAIKEKEPAKLSNPNVPLSNGNTI